MRSLKIVGLVLLTLAVIGAFYAGYRHFSKPTIHVVRQVPLTREDLQSTLNAVGSLSSRDELALAAPVSSTVTEVPVDTGAKVTAGQILAIFDQKDFGDRLLAAQASEREAAAEVRSALRNLRALRPIVAAGGEPQQSLRDATTQLSLARARQARAAAQAGAFTSEQRNFKLAAPVNGVITKLDIRTGQYVSQGKPVLSLVPTDHLTIRARIDQSVSSALAPGTPIEVTSESQPGVRLTLKIDRIDPSLEREGSTSYVVAWINYDPDSALQLRLNQQVDLKVVTQARRAVLALPLEGLITRSGDEFVRLLKNDRLHLQQVTTGIQDGALIEIAKGLNGDETVVVPLGRDVKAGARVRLESAVSGRVSQ